ncbi:MAG: EamA family transporter [Cyclobacteriaceae bacterium]|nr:EamA family transporter [Cyclobacteriaceae bacterium]
MSKYGNFFLFLIPAVIWGSTWFAITFQLGSVDPLVSVSYRFLLGGVILLLYARLRKLPLKFTVEQHLRSVQQGFLLFGINYWLVYLAEQTLASGLVAVAFSTLIFFNIGFGSIFMKARITAPVIIGAILGLLGTVLIYKTEFKNFKNSPEYILALLFAIGSIISASLGNITSAMNQRRAMPVVQTTAFGMLYGSVIMALIALALGKHFTIETSTAYLLSLAYLSVFGSVIAFTAYLTLIGRIGAGKAAYAIVIVPVIAISISVVYEGYQLDGFAIAGILMLVVGNIIAMLKK